MEENPCRYCTPETGRSWDCHGRCTRYSRWKKKHDEQIAQERQQRQSHWTPRTGNWYRQPDGHWRNKKSVKRRK